MPDLRLVLLKSVLFPGQSMQLVVFEPRYHRLLRECLDSGEPFGVALIREGPEVGGPAVPYSTGTTARITSALPLPDGRTALEVVGERRFRVIRLLDDRPYAHAEVEYPLEVEAALPGGLVERVRKRYAQAVRLRHVASGEYQREIDVPLEAVALANAVGALQAGTAQDRQRVLEADDLEGRLQRALELLERALTAIHRQAARAVADRFATTAKMN